MNDFDTLAEIHALQQFFTDAHEKLLAGQIVNMKGMDERISQACKAAQQSTPEQQQTYLPELTVLINLLNTYEKDLRKIQSTVGTNEK